MVSLVQLELVRSYKMYKLLKLPDGSFQDCIFRTTDNSFIPKLDNSPDYEEYLKWLAEGTTPEPAGE
jgi:hypothetical protein